MFSVEKNLPLSASCLWQAQRDYFSKEGIKAWQGQVPFFVTSNPFIAKSYAKLIAAYLRDLIQSKAIIGKEPIYIFELGTGSGQFSFYCLKALQQELQAPELKGISISYVMTDFTSSNIEFWEKQAVFENIKADYLTLDFAEFDLEQPSPLFLRRSQKRLNKLKNPCIVIANYIFDSVRQDFYALEKGVLIEKHIETFVPLEDYDLNKHIVLSLRQAKIEERPKPYAWKNIPDRIETSYLRFYAEHLKQGLFSLPLGGFSALDFIDSLAPQGFMLISSDKGYNTLSEIETRHKLELVTHGSFSLDVNFHALSLYFESLGGRAKLQSYRDGIKTNVFLSKNFATSSLDRAYTEYVEGLSPADYFHYHRRFREDKQFDLSLMLTQLILSCYDPYVFSLFIDKICEAVKKAPSSLLLEAYCKIIPQLYQHIYPLPQGTDHYFNLGLFLHTLQHYQAAIPYYEDSLHVYGEKFASLYNLGICKHMMEVYAEAKTYFESAIPLEGTESKKALEWLQETNKKLYT